MSSLCLRRKKEMKFVDLRLLKLEEFISRVTFTKDERGKYDAFLDSAKGTLRTYHRAEGRNAAEAYSHLLEILLRMRQVCNHYELCGDERIKQLMSALASQKTVNLTPENKRVLKDLVQLAIEAQDDCPVCLEALSLHEPVITPCAHTFGRKCITRVITTQQKCPMCRAALMSEADLLEPRHEYGDGDDGEGSTVVEGSSTKLDALLKILNASRASGNKTVVFSQWTRFLDIVQSRLEKEGFKFCRIDGTMTAIVRDRALRALDEDESCTIMLASLGVCAVGLNLVAANQVILADTWWAPAIEDQAIDCVHRLGQTKPVKVFRLVVDDTIEDRVLEIQTDKRKLMMMAFREKTSKRGAAAGEGREGHRRREARVADIGKLLR
ncbi:hypothetical protein AAFC00_000506 [Neodothiora populina]|uniref:Uncharacterized protein n=1 Tax=Neodothiora populina TaxID=2781224 RepID=A0ABR3PEA3_9PEZI